MEGGPGNWTHPNQATPGRAMIKIQESDQYQPDQENVGLALSTRKQP